MAVEGALGVDLPEWLQEWLLSLQQQPQQRNNNFVQQVPLGNYPYSNTDDAYYDQTGGDPSVNDGVRGDIRSVQGLMNNDLVGEVFGGDILSGAKGFFDSVAPMDVSAAPHRSLAQTVSTMANPVNATSTFGTVAKTAASLLGASNPIGLAAMGIGRAIGAGRAAYAIDDVMNARMGVTDTDPNRHNTSGPGMFFGATNADKEFGEGFGSFHGLDNIGMEAAEDNMGPIGQEISSKDLAIGMAAIDRALAAPLGQFGAGSVGHNVDTSESEISAAVRSSLNAMGFTAAENTVVDAISKAQNQVSEFGTGIMDAAKEALAGILGASGVVQGHKGLDGVTPAEAQAIGTANVFGGLPGFDLKDWNYSAINSFDDLADHDRARNVGYDKELSQEFGIPMGRTFTGQPVKLFDNPNNVAPNVGDNVTGRDPIGLEGLRDMTFDDDPVGNDNTGAGGADASQGGEDNAGSGMGNPGDMGMGVW